MSTGPASEPGAPVGDGPLDDIRDEAHRVAGGAVAAGIRLRLMGGMAVYLTSPTVRRPPYARDYGDFDFAVAAKDARAAAAYLEAAGYVAERMFNAIHGAQRLNFQHPDGRWPIDVVVDEVRMSHRIDLRGRLGGPGATLDAGRPAPDQAPDLGDQPEGPGRPRLPAGRPCAGRTAKRSS